MNTPEELLEYCCGFPACYDPLYELCVDTCRKCETSYPVTSYPTRGSRCRNRDGVGTWATPPPAERSLQSLIATQG